MERTIRVGAVSYLNAKPLCHGLEGYAPEVDLLMDLPSKLADRLAAGDLDVALIPSIEYLRNRSEGYQILPDLAIASSGPVRSVRLFSRVPLDQIRRLALDIGSRTSQALCRIWLHDQVGVVPERVEQHPMGVPIDESTADAILLIGDRAMKVPEAGFTCVIDMAHAWRSLTGLPFVFALWVARPDVELGDLPEILRHCRDQGLAHAHELASTYGPRLGLDVSTCYDYLTVSLSYNLGPLEIAGLREFARRATVHGLAPGGADLVFHHRPDLATSR